MKYLVVGLGNPGKEYENTRHNIGFKTLDSLAMQSGVSFSLDRHAETTTIKHKGRVLILIKPTTFMNLSGKAVNYWLQAQKIPIENLLVITDDLALPFGMLRLRAKGSDGGHNGLKDINEKLKTTQYARLRFGVGSDFSRGKQVDYVLSEWVEEEQNQLEQRILFGTEIVKSFVTAGVARTMSDFNKRKLPN